MKKSEITRYTDVRMIKARETEMGDWVLIFGRNKPEGSDKNPRLAGTGASAFDVIHSPVEATSQEGNPRIRTMNGSIAPNTMVKITRRGGI